MRVLLVEPLKQPRTVDIDCNLDAMYRVLDCRTITAVYPWDDPVALVTDDEGMLQSKTPNRYIPELRQPILGNFFLCGISAEDFDDLPEDLIVKYTERFQTPELISIGKYGISVILLE